MLIVKHLMPAGATVEDAQRAMEQPGVAEKLANIKTAKSATKTRMKAVWGPEIAEVFLPAASRPGRPKLVELKSVWNPLAQGLLEQIAEKLEVDLPLPEDAEFWTEENASLASDAIHERYTNKTTAVLNATKLRNILKSFGVDETAINATKRSAATTEHNANNMVRREERQAAGINVPPEFRNVGDLISRAETFISQPATKRPTSQDAADFLVIWSARPGEAQSLHPGPTGGVIGALKKRNLDGGEYPVASAVGTALALKFLASWRARDALAVKAAMNGLTARVKKWDIKRPDLRAIGADLAIRAAKESGLIANAGQENSYREKALRHGAPQTEAKPEEVVKQEGKEPKPENEPPKLKPARKSAQDHYTRVNDPSIPIAAKLANATPKMQSAISALLSASESDANMICALIAKMKL